MRSTTPTDVLTSLVAYGPQTTEDVAREVEVSYIWANRLLAKAEAAGHVERNNKRTPTSFVVTELGKAQLWFLEA